MATQDYVNKLPKEASLLSNHLNRFRRMLQRGLFGPEPRPVLREDEYFYSNRELADFMNCSPSTTRRWRHKGLIKSSRHGQCVLTHIPTLLETVANDDRLSAMFLRRSRPRRRPKPPVARYNCFIRKGWLWIVVRFLGKDTTIVVRQKQWNSDERIAHLVKEVISFRLSSKTSKTAGHEKN